MAGALNQTDVDNLSSLDDAYALAGIEGDLNTVGDMRFAAHHLLDLLQEYDDIAMLPEESLRKHLEAQGSSARLAHLQVAQHLRHEIQIVPWERTRSTSSSGIINYKLAGCITRSNHYIGQHQRLWTAVGRVSESIQQVELGKVIGY